MPKDIAFKRILEIAWAFPSCYRPLIVS